MSFAGTILQITSFLIFSMTASPQTNVRTGQAWIDETELARRLTELEHAAAESPAAEVHPLVRRFAIEMIHTEVRVRSARVIATYKRENWRTRPYFAVNSVPDDYFYLDEADPRFQDELARNLYWVSVVKSLPDRQLMFELAIDKATFETLESEQLISFSCEIAGVIRGGKSVYSRLISHEREGNSTR